MEGGWGGGSCCGIGVTVAHDYDVPTDRRVNDAVISYTVTTRTARIICIMVSSDSNLVVHFMLSRRQKLCFIRNASMNRNETWTELGAVVEDFYCNFNRL